MAPSLRRLWPKLPRFRRLRTKLTAYSLALFALVLCGAMTAVYASIVRNAERVVSHELAASAGVFDRVWELKTAQLENAAGLLSRDFGFRAAVATGDQATIQTALQNLRRRLGVSLSFVVGADGGVLASEGEGAPAAARAWLDAGGAAASGVLLSPAGAHQAVSAPILAPTPVGEVVFASRIDKAELAALVRLSPIAFRPHLLVETSDGHWSDAARGLSAEELANAAAVLAKPEAARPQVRKIGPWIEVVRPLHTLGSGRAALVLRYPLAEALAPYNGLLALVLLLAAAGLSLLAAAAWLIAQEVTRPIAALSTAAQRLERGERVEVEVHGRDEIAALGASFNSMAHGIARREAALELARDEAQAADRAKTQFLANMSHEIRTPLNGILGMAQVMALKPGETDQAQSLKVIRDSGESLLAILNSILDLSRIEGGRLELDAQDFDLAETVALASAPFAELARGKGLAFELEVAAAPGETRRGDPLRLRQVLAALLSNAVKFTETGMVGVRVEASGDRVRVAVRDTGVGIAPERLQQVFERFAQGDNSDTRRFGGVGVGLALCREIARLMDGGLSVDSTPGAGSCFVFEAMAPVCVKAAGIVDEHPEEIPDEGPAEAADGEPPPLRVLAVDDNATNRAVLGALLEPVGATVAYAENGEEAVSAFRGGVFDVILMDIQMPVMNGVDATRAIRTLERGRRVPIVAVTANVMAEQIEEYRAAGVDGVVGKPVQAQVLYDAIEAAFELAESRQAQPAAARGGG
jgi:signal transduction histidine kinase/CheY-like chemotaxis protein